MLEKLEAARAGGSLSQDEAAIEAAHLLRAPERAKPELRAAPEDSPYEATPLFSQITQAWPDLMPQTRAYLTTLGFGSLEPGSVVVLSPGTGDDCTYSTANFDFHYDADTLGWTGGCSPPGYVTSAGTYFEASWSKFVTDYGWTAPPSDAVSGCDAMGSSRYDVFMTGYPGIPPGAWGLTATKCLAQQGGASAGDNENSPVLTESIAMSSVIGLVTDPGSVGATIDSYLGQAASHEFHHALQYGYWGSSDPWLQEATAEWAQTEVDPLSPNWYWNPHHIGHLDLSLSDTAPAGGEAPMHAYSTWLFIRYYAEHHGGQARIREIWEQHATQSGWSALNTAMAGAGTSFPTVFLRQTVANKVMTANALYDPYDYAASVNFPAGFREAAVEDGIVYSGLPAIYDAAASGNGNQRLPALSADLVAITDTGDLDFRVCVSPANPTAELSAALIRQTIAGAASVSTLTGSPLCASSGAASGWDSFTVAVANTGTAAGSALYRLNVFPEGSPPERVSTDAAWGEVAGASHRPAPDMTGTEVAFHSTAPDLVAGDSNGSGDVFVKNTVTGAIERVSVPTGGGEASGGSRFPAITPDGRFVAFMSDASDLTAGDTNGAEDVFVHDRVADTTARVSVATGGGQALGGDSRFPSISDDGRYVAFQSEASNLVASDTNGRWDVFVHDRALSSTVRASLTTNEQQGGYSSTRPSISGDGRYVAFHSWARFGSDTNGVGDVYLRDLLATTTVRASIPQGGGEANGESLYPKISGDGSVVAFHSLATNLVSGDTNGQRDVFVRIVASATTQRVSVATGGGQADAPSGYASISDDGRYVAFHSTSALIAAGDSNGAQDVFVRDRTAGATGLGSVSAWGSQGNGLSGSAAISRDGRFVAFHSDAANLVTTDANAQRDVFVAASSP